MQDGCVKARQSIEKTYAGYLYSLSLKYYGKYAWFYSSVDEVQILVKTGFEIAMTTFNQDRGAKFFTHAYNVIKFSILNNLKRHRAMSLSKELCFTDFYSEEYMVSDALVDKKPGVLDEIVNDEILNDIKNVIGEDSYQIVKAKHDGYSYEEISSIHNVTKKHVDNTIQKARKVAHSLVKLTK